MENKLVLIFGASGSGKSFLSNRIKQHFKYKVVLLEQDNYYKGIGSKEKVNFDHPDSLDFDLLVNHLFCLLQAKKPIEAPIYDFVKHHRLEQSIECKPKDIVVIVGTMVMADERIASMASLKIFCKTPLDICLVRRLRRDIVERGRNVESVLKQYLDEVRPGYKKYIEPYIDQSILCYDGGNFADIIDSVEGALL